MTAIHYREGHASFNGTHFDVAGVVRKLLHSWHQWQTEREIESMPFDIRKDIGWPSADEADEQTPSNPAWPHKRRQQPV